MNQLNSEPILEILMRDFQLSFDNLSFDFRRESGAGCTVISKKL